MILERNTNINRRPKKPSFKDEAIDVNELAGMSNVEGLLSFLDRSPQDYARMFAEPGSLPQPIDDKAGCEAASGSTVLAGGNLPPDSKLHPDSSLPPDSSLRPDRNLPSDSDLLAASDQGSDRRLLPGSNVRTESSFPPQTRVHPGSNLPPDSNLIAGLESVAPVPPLLSHHSPVAVRSNPPSDSNLLPGSDLHPATTTLLPGGDLRTSNGRVVRIRPAKSVQDAHTTGEHLLLQSLWKKANTETDETRLIRAGLSDLSRWTGSHKTSCRDYLRSLIQKLAIEEVASFDAASASARTYRIFSFTAILDRRRRANLTHVVRTGAVFFVDPSTGEKVQSGKRQVADHRLLPDSSLPPDSNFLADSSLPIPSGSSQGREPGSNLPPLIKNTVKQTTTTTSPIILEALQNTLGYADDDAVQRILVACRQKVADAHEFEIVDFIRFHAPRIRRNRGIDNPMGALIRYLPHCFEGESFRKYRESQAELWRQVLENPDSTEEDRQMAGEYLGLKR